MRRTTGAVSLMIMTALLLTGCASKVVWLPLWTTPPPGSTVAAHAQTVAPSPSATAKKNTIFTNDVDTMDSPSVTVYKSLHMLEVWDGDKLMARMKIAIGKTPEGAKAKTGDNKTPEGKYYICRTGEGGKFYKMLFLSYPNTEDAQAGLDAGLISQSQYNAIKNAIDGKKQPPWDTDLGGEIAITGTGTGGQGKTGDWTAGSIAVSDENMDYLWKYIKVGVDVEIKP